MSLTHRPSRGNIIRGFAAAPVPGVSTIRHLGTDYGWGNGFEVFAAASGRVFGVSWSASRATNNRSGGYGNSFQIDHGNGLTTLYAHQPTSPMLVANGQQVTGGQRVGTKGNTGNASGAHLHFEARINGVPVNAEPLFSSATASLNETEIDMSLDNKDLVNILNAGFDNKNLGGGNHRTIAQALSAIYFYGDLANQRALDGIAATSESIRIGNENWLAIGRIRDRPSSVIDVAKLAAALTSAGLTVTIDAAAIAKAVDASLRDDFAAIPGAVLGGLKEAL